MKDGYGGQESRPIETQHSDASLRGFTYGILPSPPAPLPLCSASYNTHPDPVCMIA